MPSQLERAISVFSCASQRSNTSLTRLAASTARDLDPESLLSERLADDMHPLAFQIVFTAEQPRQLVAFCANCEPGDFAAPTSLTLDSAKALLREVRGSVQVLAVDTQADALARIRTLSLMGGITLQLQGDDYLDDFLLPNFYFHLVTAYDILRHKGVSLGKADYMAHLAAKVRRA